MPSETVPPADPPLRSNGSTLRQKRFPISKLKCAIEQSKNKLQDTDIQLVKIQEVAERSGHLYSDLAGDLIVHRTRVEKGLNQLEEYERTFGVMKYLHFGKKPVVLLDECERTLALAKSTSEIAWRIWETCQKPANPRSRFNRASNPPDHPDDDEEDRVSVGPASRSSPHTIVINGQATLNFHNCHTTVRNISLASPSADGFTLNCHTTASRGSEHNNFPPTSASEAPAPESATPGSGV